MLFNSIDFAIFLPIVFAVYWLLSKRALRVQNLWLLVTSYVFYGWWDWRFLSLIALSTLVDFTAALRLRRDAASPSKFWLWVSLSVNLGLLGVFKYYGFFLDNLQEAFTFFGREVTFQGIEWVLPVGISFYTFQTLSYTLDVYRGKIEPSRDLIAFAAYVSFFPQLVAGPIERASHLLPQIQKARSFVYTQASDGVNQILWGLFKKLVIADQSAVYVNYIFEHAHRMNPLQLFAGAVLFAFQIYGDFSGYSDIAIGTARLFGIDLRQNFAFPYFSRDIAEFWRRWHISLSTWFRDYLYIPLGGSRTSTVKVICNTFIIFVVSGFWHGANWTFVLWGLAHALLFIPLLVFGRNRRHLQVVAQDRLLPRLTDIARILLTFILVTLAWILFRADSLTEAGAYYFGLLDWTKVSGVLDPKDALSAMALSGMMILMIVMEWRGRRELHALVPWLQRSLWKQQVLRICLVWIIILFMNTGQEDFIYFQF